MLCYRILCWWFCFVTLLFTIFCYCRGFCHTTASYPCFCLYNELNFSQIVLTYETRLRASSFSIHTGLSSCWNIIVRHPVNNLNCRQILNVIFLTEKRKRSDSVLWQKPLYPQKNPTWKKKTKQRDNIKKNATKNFNYTTIADRFGTVSWSNSNHPTGVVKPVYEHSTFPLTITSV